MGDDYSSWVFHIHFILLHYHESYPFFHFTVTHAATAACSHHNMLILSVIHNRDFSRIQAHGIQKSKYINFPDDFRYFGYKLYFVYLRD